MKKIAKYICLLALFGMMVSCVPGKDWWFGEGDWVQKIDSSEIIHVIQEHLAYLRHVKRLRLEDSRIYYNHYVNTIRLEFTSQDLLEIREARMLLVDVVEGLLAALNQNPIVGENIFEYPLSPAHLEIYINMESFYGIYDDPYYVGWIKLENDTAYYYAFDQKLPGLNTWDYRKEPYSKSRELVVQEREAENLFEEVYDAIENQPDPLEKEQYRPVIKCRPRYYSPYDTCEPIFK